MKVYFIGAGAGDPELITVRGKRILEKCEVIIYAGSLVNPQILESVQNAKIYNSATMTLEEILQVIERAVAEGKDVARLHTGDPSLYGAIQEQIDYLQSKNIATEVIPGVSSFVAAAASLKREFTLPGVSQTVIITRLEGRTSVPEKEKLAELAKHQSSMAIFLSVQMIEEVVEELLQGYPETAPAAVIYRASWPDQITIKGTLGDIADQVRKRGINKTAMILVGDFLDCAYNRSKLYDHNFCHAYRKNKDRSKKAILVVSFGTSYPKTRTLTIDACEEDLKKAFPDYDLVRAFTSRIIIDKLKRRDNLIIDTPGQALQRLKDKGYREVIVQPLHIIPGYEYHDLCQEVKPYERDFDLLKVGEPLLNQIEDYQQVITALKIQLPSLKEKQGVVFMGHGTDHPANASYACLDYVFKDYGYQNIFVGTVEGYPQLDSVYESLKKNNITEVCLMPFMLVAGDHALNDMSGTDQDSWEIILKNKGLKVTSYLKGLGENKQIRQIYVNKVKKLIINSLK